ncbi:hypothetical protein [Geoalkalibacter halelectricus]|uniref:hypothetical protein n=1 Tax=Geoalkalibacter halelectricus TaxID=2847045 RepID=UPI002670855B|nr:hypothetical protein [Geoalkalibacter halelectricus]MDO3380391.1 hypothetical protein [Geoalkalibacter halelectricus]
MTTTKLDSYRIEKCAENPEDEPLAIAYKLYGKKTIYALIRNHHRPFLLFPVNLTTMKTAKIAGASWLTDRDGQLRIAC